MWDCEQFYIKHRPKSGAEFFELFHHSKNSSALNQRLACFAYFKYLFCFFFIFGNMRCVINWDLGIESKKDKAKFLSILMYCYDSAGDKP